MATKPKPKQYIKIKGFRGVDFANDETEVDYSRSPWAPNMMSDLEGQPVIRPGYKTELELSNRINGIHFHKDTMLVHYGENISVINRSNEGAYSIGATFTGLNDDFSQSFFMGKTYILDGKKYLQFDGNEFSEVEGYIPTTSIARAPAGGGTDLESVNMLTGWRINSFTTDGTAAEFVLDGEELAADTVRITVGGEEKTEGTHFTVDRTAGKVIFTEGNVPADDTGIDSVIITFKMSSDSREKVERCRICTTYGLGNDTRAFITGDPQNINTDYMSGLYDPTYFPDLGYTKIGSDDTAIIGYVKQYGQLVIVKEYQGGRGGLYLRSATTTENGDPVFPVYEGIQGIGAASPRAIGTLNGDPLMLTLNGVFGLESNSITQQQSVQRRSRYIDPKLRKIDVTKACVCAWDRFILIAEGNEMFAGYMGATNGNRTGSYGYEWYWWTDIPARVLKEHEGTLFIGTEEGALRRLKDPIKEGMQAYSDDGRGIDAMWTTPLLDGGNFMREKTISKKGTGILAKPFARSSGEIFFTTDKTLRQATKNYMLDILDFDDVDFDRFTFNMSDQPQVIISPKKFRKIKLFQMGVRHTAPNEGFGVLGFMITFTVGNLTRKDTGNIV
ncbi:MAG: hypothetical protein IJD14_04890 [Christensenellaceae bacterium]|nr:hypothetical protein [Christensenellaceae bacterium]